MLLEALPLAKLNTNIGKPSLREKYVYFPKYANAIFMQQKLKDNNQYKSWWYVYMVPMRIFGNEMYELLHFQINFTIMYV